MKTAISIPDEVFMEAERLTRRLNKSRSRLYTDAVREFLARHDPDSVTEALNQVADLVDSEPDPAVSAAGQRLLKRVEW
jgi:metal-responsive CopG/Arc/MetJ family transcriptional regulator